MSRRASRRRRTRRLTEGAGQSVNLGSFSDPGPDSPWAVDVDWGDGSTHTTFTAYQPGQPRQSQPYLRRRPRHADGDGQGDRQQRRQRHQNLHGRGRQHRARPPTWATTDRRPRAARSRSPSPTRPIRRAVTSPPASVTASPARRRPRCRRRMRLRAPPPRRTARSSTTAPTSSRLGSSTVTTATARTTRALRSPTWLRRSRASPARTR